MSGDHGDERDRASSTCCGSVAVPEANMTWCMKTKKSFGSTKNKMTVDEVNAMVKNAAGLLQSLVDLTKRLRISRSSSAYFNSWVGFQMMLLLQSAHIYMQDVLSPKPTTWHALEPLPWHSPTVLDILVWES